MSTPVASKKSYFGGYILFISMLLILSKTLALFSKHICHDKRYLPMPTFHHRWELGTILQNLDFKIGVELGVQTGAFAFETLKAWKTADEYVLVDIWASQQNYTDIANFVDHNAFMALTESRMKDAVAKGWLKQYKMCRNFTSSCVCNFEDLHFDYIFVDARHDYKGVLRDIVEWWPKLKVGGIMAGHDYTTQIDPTAKSDPARSGQN
jgi:heme-degrading monooxygenase HmoA